MFFNDHHVRNPVALTSHQTIARRLAFEIGRGFVELGGIDVFERIDVNNAIAVVANQTDHDRDRTAASVDEEIGCAGPEPIALELTRIGNSNVELCVWMGGVNTAVFATERAAASAYQERGLARREKQCVAESLVMTAVAALALAGSPSPVRSRATLGMLGHLTMFGVSLRQQP